MICKTKFSIFEITEIRIILEKLVSAQTKEKKQLRATLRKKHDFHISFFDNNSSGFDSNKLDVLINTGHIQVYENILSNKDITTPIKTTGQTNTDIKRRTQIKKRIIIEKDHKLRRIAKLIVFHLESTHKTKTSYTLEYKPKWLTCVPSKISLRHFGKNIQDAYFELTDKRLDLTERLKQVEKEGQQSFDIWINEPFNFAVEFDESQHFNQFRLSTLNFYETISTGFNIELYKSLSSCFTKPSTSGFTKLKKPTLLFPEFLLGLEQDNRIRERAFRDLLKDLIPKSMGFNNTIRIPYHVVGKKTNIFSDSDLANVLNYLKKYDLLSNLSLTI